MAKTMTLITPQIMSSMQGPPRPSEKRVPRGYYTDLAGQLFGDLTVVRFEGMKESKNGAFFPSWLCKCKCGNEKPIRGNSLRDGGTKSCGCHRKGPRGSDRSKKSYHPLYSIWRGMLARCKNPKSNSYKDYGGRGISICKQWHDFEAFCGDMGERPEGRSIDRIDNDGNYEPGNCRWATALQQANNKRKYKKAGQSTKT